MRTLAIGLATAIVLLIVGCTGSDTYSEHAEELIDQFGVTTDELAEIQSVADDEGWTIEEALDRTGWYWGFARFVQSLRTTYPDEFAGATIDAQNGPRNVSIAFTRITPADVPIDPRLEHLDVNFVQLIGINEVKTSIGAPGVQVAEIHYALEEAGFRNLVSVPFQYAGRTVVIVERREADAGQSDAEILPLMPGVARGESVEVRFVDSLESSR